MPFFIPSTSRLVPLTRKATTELLAATRVTSLVGVCGDFNCPTDLQDVPADDHLIMRAMQEQSAKNHVLFKLNKPSIDDQPGPYHGTYFYHPDLTAFLRKTFRGTLPLEVKVKITPNAGGLKIELDTTRLRNVTVTSVEPGYAFADLPTIAWTKDPPDEDFLARAFGALYADDRYGRKLEWISRLCTWFAPGLAGFAGVDKGLTLIIDSKRYPLSPVPQLTTFNHAAVAVYSLIDVPYGVYDEDDALLLLLQQTCAGLNIPCPAKLERTYIAWQRYLPAR